IPNLSTNAATIYVAPSGSLAWGGQTVYNDVTSAITAAATGDEIWIASGTYEIGSGGINYNVAKNLKFYGSFAGTETSIDERAKVNGGEEWEFQHPTILKMTVGSTCIWVNNSAITATFDGLTLDGDNISGTRGIGGGNWTELSITRCIIKNNNTGAANGAGILGTKKIIVDYCWIENNTSSKQSSGNKWGNGICILAASSKVSNSLISNNTKTGGDNGGGIGVDNVAGVVISGCRIINNSAFFGGGICAFRLDDIHDCWIEGNTATGKGGGVHHHVYSGSGVIYNSVIINNTSTDVGGGINFNARNNACNVKTYNCVIANNTGSDGGVSFANATTTPAQMINCILYNNKNVGGTVSNVTAAGTNNVFNNNIIDNASITNLTQTNCIVETDPAKLFADIDNGDYTIPVSNFAGLNKGDATGLTFADNKDYAGVSRVQGTAIEIGAYEFTPTQQIVNLTVDAGIASTTPATVTEVTTGDPLTISFTLQSTYHTPYVSVNDNKYAFTESAGTYTFTIPTVNETQNITISSFAENEIPASEDTWVNNQAASTEYNSDAFLNTRNAYSAYSNRRAYLRFNLPASIRTNYNKAELKLYNGSGADRDNNNLSVRTVTSTISDLTDFSTLTWTTSGATAASYDGTELALLSPAVMKATPENTELTTDLTNHIFGGGDTDNSIDLQIATDTDGYIRIKSFENGNADYVPVLVFSQDLSTALPEVSDKSTPARYFTLQGVEVLRPVKGNVYIVKQGADVKKIMFVK
ncbi:MAG: DNRLRE domain-containing protein, partial [Paludibacteraceae bacterium]